MEDLRSQLKRLVLREPSSTLDERVRAVLGAEPVSSRFRVPRVSVTWAAAAALLMGAAGFWMGVVHGRQPAADHPPAGRTPETVRFVVDSTVAGNPFDFSSPVNDRLSGGWKTEITLIEDTER